MNRIICDICGSEYPENAERCPICSYPRQGNEKTVAAATEAAHAKVKGGRFSSKNVKKRRKAQLRAEANAQEKNPNRPLIITIIILLIAIILVSVYIGVRFLRGRDVYLPAMTTTAPTTAAPTQTTVLPTVPCSGIVLETQVLDLENKGDQKQLNVLIQPADTTDTVVYQSADPAIAAVSETGLITAVGSGQTTVSITCGDVTQTLTVVCWFQEETTLPPETTAPAITEPKATEPKATEPKPTPPKPTEAPVLKLDPEDVSCFSAGEVFTLYARLGTKTVGRSKVTWTTSDPKIATVDNGTVTAVGKGVATITAEYDGQKAYCTVRCRFENPAPNEGEDDQQSQGGQQSSAWKASHSDVTIKVGEVFRLKITNAAGETADAIWTMNKEGIVSIDGKKVVGRAPGEVTLTTTVEGQTFTCIVRVK